MRAGHETASKWRWRWTRFASPVTPQGSKKGTGPSVQSPIEQQIEPILRDPAWLPHAYDAGADTLTFAYIPREKQRGATFLFDEKLGELKKSAPIPLTALPLQRLRAEAPPIHFIFHTGYCCSTLLCRALDVPGVSMALKEPQALYSISEPLMWGKDVEGRLKALEVILDLMSRGLTPGETQIVKTTYTDIALVQPILDSRPTTRALFLHGPLDEFLRSVAKRGLHGRANMRGLYERLSQQIALPTGYSAVDLFRQTDLQISALNWLMQIARYQRLARHYAPSGRVRTLSADALLANKVSSLKALAALFGLQADAAKWDAIAAGPAFKQNAKRPNEIYDDEMRAREQAALKTAHGKEIDMVSTWLDAVAKHCNVDMKLGDTLLENS